MNRASLYVVVVAACHASPPATPVLAPAVSTAPVVAPVAPPATAPPATDPATLTAWSWAVSLLPELAALRAHAPLTPADAPWFVDGQTFTLFTPRGWITEETRGATTCVPVAMRAQGKRLHAVISHAGGPPPRFGCRKELLLEGSASLVEGECVARDGSRSVMGDGRLMSGGMLLTIDHDGSLVYDAVPVTAAPRCAWRTVERPTCSERACRSCQLVAGISGGTHNTIVGFAPNDPPPVTDASCTPCPVDSNAALVPALTAIVRGRQLLKRHGGRDVLRFFRTKAECEVRLRDER